MRIPIFMTTVGLLGLVLMASGASADLPRIILDTDMRGDCDDAGALALLHALADNGDCEILGVMASTTGPHVVGTISAINNFYGRPDLPVGLYSGEGLRGGDDYAPVVGDPAWFPHRICNETAPDSTALYRQLLHESPDNSVSIVVIGGQPCVYRLLESEADYEGDGSINMTGAELAEAKVRELVLMAANFVNPDHGEWNVILDVTAAQTVARDWPTPIMYSGFEIGHIIQTGGTLTEPETNPVAMSYKLYRGTQGGVGVIGNRSSWDQTAVYYAVHGREYNDALIWDKEGPMTVSFDDEGRTRYEMDPDGNHHRLTEHMPIEDVEAIIEDLMTQPPRARVSLDSPAAGAVYTEGASVTLQVGIEPEDAAIRRVVYLVDDSPVATVTWPPYSISGNAPSPGTYIVQAYVDLEDGGRFYTQQALATVIPSQPIEGVNEPDADVNLALVEDAQLSGSVPSGEGRGTPEVILFDPAKGDYHVQTAYNEYGVSFGENLGLVTEEDPFFWQVEWEEPKNINEITFGGTYPNQQQPFAQWKLQYRHDGSWQTLLEGQGGWINTGILQWGGPGSPAIATDAVRVIVYSDGTHPVTSIHLRGRGGQSEERDDRDTEPKATVIRYR